MVAERFDVLELYDRLSTAAFAIDDLTTGELDSLRCDIAGADGEPIRLLVNRRGIHRDAVLGAELPRGVTRRAR